MKIPSTVKKMLENKYVLYVVLFLSITNVLGYLATQDFNALTFFIIVGFLTTYFSKNMIIVLLVAMISTNFLSMTKNIPRTVEAMTNKKNKNDKEESKDKENKNPQAKQEGKAPPKESLKSRNKLSPADLKGNKVNYQDTVEAAYDNLDKILDSGAIEKMSNDTDNLMKRQNKLAGQIEKFGPILEKAHGMLNKLPIDKMNSMLNKLGGMGGMAGNNDE